MNADFFSGVLAELSNWEEYTRIFIGLFALIAPPIVVPLYLGLLAGRPLSTKLSVAFISAISFFLVTGLFALTGASILSVFGISLPAFRIAGGFLVLMIALDLMRSNPHEEATKPTTGSALAIAIVPITIPVLAGPGALSSVVIFASQHGGTLEHKVLVLAVLFVLALYVWGIFTLTAFTSNLFGLNVQLVFNRVMGLLLCAIAVEFMLSGLGAYFPDIFVEAATEAIEHGAHGNEATH